MGNTTNLEKWDARQRLALIEQAAFWRGWVVRADLVDAFGLSLPQASADLQAYLKLNPDGLHYDLRAKRYWGAPDMQLKLAAPDLAGAIHRFLGPEAKGMAASDRIATIDLPTRAAPIGVARNVFRAICQTKRLHIHYYSLTSARAQWRWISPHAFAHDGYRWHVRAFCHEDNNYKDFVIGRIAAAQAPVEGELPASADEEWTTWEKIRLRPNAELDAVQRKAVELDYDMHRGTFTLNVRRSMKGYTLAYLHLGEARKFSRHLELDE